MALELSDADQPPRQLPAPVGAVALPAQRPPLADLAIQAQDDAQAAAAWLRAKGGRPPHTFDAYRREATRLLLWTAEQRLVLADLKVDDVHRFWAHLSSPPAHWIRPRKPRRDEVR